MINVDVDNVIEVLNEIQPSLWGDNKATTLMHDNPFRQMNRILVHHDACLWHSFHDASNWDCELELDNNGVLVTEYRCSIDYDKHNSFTILSYYGAHCDYEAYDY